MMNETWREILELLPPLIFLFFLVYSPSLMRFIQKRLLIHEARIKKNSQGQDKERELSAKERLLSGENRTGRTVTDTPEILYHGADQKAERVESLALKRVETLAPLKKAVIWAEILGPPGGLGSGKKNW